LLTWDNPGFICLRLENPELEQASKLEYIDYVIPKLTKEDRHDYEAFLKRELPDCF
ncbi:MAG: hypothetical protein GY870_07355, partial [archaeon]|nr:hypothetical protein [archaeon]